MKSFLSTILMLVFVLGLTACGCSNSMADDTQTPNTTLIPNILPTLDTNIPDPDIDTQMPIYTEGSDSTAETDLTIPVESDSTDQK